MEAVSTLRRAAMASASPLTETTGGSTVTDETAYPSAGLPTTSGLTGRVRDWAREVTTIRTWTLGGSISTGLLVSPKTSTATRGTSASTSRPEGWMTTWARAAVTSRTTDAGPATTALWTESWGVPTWRP